MHNDLINYDIPKTSDNSIITVIGIGGAGNNTVNNLYRRGVDGISFVNCNTDAQVLSASPVPVKILLGEKLTHGKGAGDDAEVGEKAALENESDIRAVLSDGTKMLFITAGMGAGTGTGASCVIANIAKEMGILTVAVVSFPSPLEGKKHFSQAYDGLLKLQESVDSLLVLKNDVLFDIFEDLPVSQALKKSDDIIATAVKGTVEIISLHGVVNIDFADVDTVLRNSRVFVMGAGYGDGEGRVMKAVKEAIESPLLADNSIHGANYILVNMIYGNTEFKMSEIGSAMKILQGMSSNNAEIIYGTMHDDSLGDRIGITIVASGFADRVKVLDELDRKKEDSDTQQTTENKSYSSVVTRETREHSNLAKEQAVYEKFDLCSESDTAELTLDNSEYQDVYEADKERQDIDAYLDKDDSFSMEDIFNEEREQANKEMDLRNEENLRKLKEDKIIEQELYADKQRKERERKEFLRQQKAEDKKKRQHLQEVQRKKDEEKKIEKEKAKRSAFNDSKKESSLWGANFFKDDDE